MVACFLFTSIYALTETHTHSVHFNTDKHNITQEEQNALAVFLSSFSPHDDLSIQLKGHADFRGSLLYNEALSDRRSSSVKAAIIAAGFSPELILSNSFGERIPIVQANEDDVLRANRRVEIVVTKHYFENTDQILAALGSNNKWELEVEPDEDLFFESDRGSAISIPKNSFVDKDGNVIASTITVTVTEAIAPSDFVSEKLLTQSDGEIIESGGMMKLAARDPEGNEVFLSDQANVQIGLPTNELKDEMQLFVSEEGKDWESTEERPINATTARIPLPPERKKMRKVLRPELTLPKKPSLPIPFREPELPSKPDLSSLNPHFEWYQIFGRKKARKKAQARKKVVMDSYERKMDRYDRKKRRYDKSVEEHPQRLEIFAMDVKEWEERCAQIEWEYLTVVIPAYEQALQSENEVSLAAYQERLKEWRVRKDSIILSNAQALEAIANIGFDVLNQYIYRVNQMGWINCDRFRNFPPEELNEVLVQDDHVEEDKRVMLSFKDMNSLLPLHQAADQWQSQPVPPEQNPILLAIKAENGRIMLSQEEAVFGTKMEFDFEAVTLAELRKLLNQDTNESLSYYK